MKEETFSLQSSLEANYLNIGLQEPVRLDEIAVRVIKGDCPEFLIPFRIVAVNDKVTLKYKLINTIALEYSDRTLGRREFVRLYLNLLIPFIKGKDWFLDYHYFCIDPRFVFLDKLGTSAYFIYVPEASYRNTDEEILQFFHNTFTGISIPDDANFQVRLYRFFSGKDITLSDLYQMLLQESPDSGTEQGDIKGRKQESNPVAAPPQEALFAPPQKPCVSGEKKATGLKLPFLTEAKPVSEKKTTRKNTGDFFGTVENDGDGETDAVMEALFGDGKKKKEKGAVKKPLEQKSGKKKEGGGFAFFGKKKLEEASAPVPSSAPPAQGNLPQTYGGFVSMNGDGDDRTEISPQNSFAAAACMELVESPIPGAIPRISLNFAAPYIIIGRMSSDEVQPDVAFGREFSRIGRRHARIEKRDGVYYVIDLGSANHTLLNEQTLIPNQAYPLTEGSILTFTASKPVRYRIRL